MTDLSDFAAQYIETALWASVGDDPDSIKDAHGVSDVDPDTLTALAATADRFAEAHAEDLEAHDDPTMGAHDLWLTQNGHGAGFWDGDWPQPQADRLTAAAKALGEVHLYVGDSGKIYSMEG